MSRNEQYQFAKRVETLKSSEVRELLKITELPDVISFAGGLPAPELFPIQEMSAVNQEVLQKDGHAALQYSTTEGYGILRDMIASNRMVSAGVMTNRDEILITAGSQQGIDFSARLFLNDNDYIICEDPSYLGAINVFNTYNARYITVSIDKDGMIPELLEQAIQTAPSPPKFIYTIPDFQNPTGITMSLERRKKIVEIASQYKIPIIEDNPYGDIAFNGKRNASLKSFDKNGWVIFLGTFSKILCPGLRIGWVCANKELINKYIMLKQVSDLQCNSLTQREVGTFMQKYNLDDHVNRIISVYKNRRDYMINAMIKYFPSEVTFTYPDGGLFTWVELPEKINAAELLVVALKEKVAFVPGAPFFPNGGHKNYLRLNYSNMSEDKIEEGIKRLGIIIKRFMDSLKN